MSEISAREVIATLGMERHPEGGWYVQTFEDTATSEGRARSTAIYYLLEHGDRSHWHRVDAVEVWHYYAGAPLNLRVSDGEQMDIYRLGPEIIKGDRPQVVVPQRAWQAAESIGDWTLVGCTVAPGFLYSGFELAPSDWVPGKG
jgi:predicted cupin superfamily sugar epimerase